LEAAVAEDIVKTMGPLMLGSRLKRLGERLQADTARFIEQVGVGIQPSQYPLLAALDRFGPMTVNELVEVVGISQPGVTRNLARLIEAGLIETSRTHRDQRHKTMTLTDTGVAILERSKAEVWPHVQAAVNDLCAGLSGNLLDQLGGVEDALALSPLDQRAANASAPALRIVGFSDSLADKFHDINAEWISTMFDIEATDREVLENPRERIIEPGGDILFVEAPGLGIVGTCALQKTGKRQFELTKMGVLASARGRKAGEYLLAATLERARQIGADKIYLLTNAKCAAAIHLYEKAGFEHDSGIMQEFGSRYDRCDVAMLYRPRAT
jgi:DNA-binding MarR family transcriptional regulator/N-acetylglutamate synthase-like GNAT family acetyltransferase